MYERDMARLGERLFKSRQLALYLIVILGAIIAGLDRDPLFASPALNAGYEWFWIAVALAATLFRWLTSGYAARGTSGATRDGARADMLNTSGPYSIVRNPLYVGRILTYSAIGFLSGEWTYGGAVFLLSILHFERIISYEEQFLAAKFGQAYLDWGESTPALWPRPSRWRRPDYPFWWRRAFRRESNKTIALVAAMIGYHVLRHHAATETWSVSPELAVLVLALVLARLIMATLVFFTNYFRNVY